MPFELTPRGGGYHNVVMRAAGDFCSHERGAAKLLGLLPRTRIKDRSKRHLVVTSSGSQFSLLLFANVTLPIRLRSHHESLAPDRPLSPDSNPKGSGTG